MDLSAVFDVAFDTEDEYDVPDIEFNLTQLGPILTLSFQLDEDSYNEEDSVDEDTQEE